MSKSLLTLAIRLQQLFLFWDKYFFFEDKSDSKRPLFQEFEKCTKCTYKSWRMKKCLYTPFKALFSFLIFEKCTFVSFSQLLWRCTRTYKTFLISRTFFFFQQLLRTFSKFWELFLKVYNFCKNFTISGTNITVFNTNGAYLYKNPLVIDPMTLTNRDQ